MRDGKRSSASVPLVIGIVVLILPLLYVLSIGPACRLCNDGYLDVQLYLTIYAPVLWPCEHLPAYEQAHDRYLRLWLS